MELVEVAPGVDLQHDILDQMDFAPIVRAPQLMDARIFRDEPMGLREDILRLPFEARFQYDHGQNMLFLNFEKLEVKSIALVNAIRDKVRALCEPLGHKVYAIVNYEGFVLDRDVEDAYAEMVRDVVERFYLGVTRFTTSAFMRAKLGEALAKRAVAPHIFESEAEAKAKAGLPHDLRPQ
jgi:propionate CoA-transferase